MPYRFARVSLRAISRGKQLKDLIYRATTDKGNEERSASVTLVYEREG